MVHNRYQQRGGEDAVFEAEARLLESNGIELQRFEVNNDSIHGLIPKIQTSIGQFGFASPATSQFKRVVQEFRPDVVHVHNWFATLSPSIFNICQRARIPVVHTLHNYRLLCISATLFRNGRVCEDCIGSPLRTPGIIHSCYRDSCIGSAVSTASMLAHWSSGTWTRSVDRYIALSDFARHKLIEGGLPAAKTVVKPNFVDPDPGIGAGQGDYLLYAGRLTEEKGVRTLLDCWKAGPDLPTLQIVGAGPLQDEVRRAAATLRNVSIVGSRSNDEVAELMRNATALICPSLWYEGMPRVVIESFAAGTPVIASDIGCYPEMILDGKNGALFSPADPFRLGDRVRGLMRSNAVHAMRAAARRTYKNNYTGEGNLSQLLSIYRSVLPARDLAPSRTVPAHT